MRQANRLMTIGKLAAEAGVTTHTLRHYERQGLLAPSERNQSGYRLYDAAALEQLRFIRSAQAGGFSLNDVRSLLSLNRDDTASCRGEVQRLLKKKLAEVSEKLSSLRRIQRALARSLDRCESSKGECPVLKNLGSKGKRAKTS